MLLAQNTEILTAMAGILSETSGTGRLRPSGMQENDRNPHLFFRIEYFVPPGGQKGAGMIGRRGKWLLFLYVLFLVVLFLMCSTDLGRQILITVPSSGSD